MSASTRKPLAVCLAALVTCAVLVGCTNESQRDIDALKRDPMASVTVPHLTLLSEHQSRVDSWKNPPPSFTRCFVVDGITLDEGIIALGDLAQGHGWKDPDPRPTTFDKLIGFGGFIKPADPRDTNSTMVILTAPAPETGCPLDQPGTLALLLTVGGVTH